MSVATPDSQERAEAARGPIPAASKRRVLAALLADLLLLALVWWLVFVQLGLRLLDNYSDIVELVLAWVFLIPVPALMVSVVLIDGIRVGQTPGKYALGIRRIRVEGKRRNVLAADPRVPVSSIPTLWRDVRVLRIVGQFLAVVAVVALLRWLFHNLIENLDEKNIPTSFDVLDRPFGTAIRDAPGFNDRSSVWNALLLGLKNTVAASVVGILIAGVVGLFVGMARLSSNWILAKLASLFVETLRNIPPLVVIIFFGFALFTFGPLPAFSAASPPWKGKFFGSDANWLLLSKDRSAIPSLASEDKIALFWYIVAAAAVVGIGLWYWRTRRNAISGQPHHRMLWAVGGFAVIVVISFIALGGPYSWSWPTVSENGRRVVGGFSTNSGYLALTLGLGLYTASFVAEIVRGSIQAVPKGQTEAALSVALKPGQRYRHVVLPQALRIAIPPYISENLNLIKNTSLGIAVAYPELFLVGNTAIANGNPALQILVIMMGMYLGMNLIVSALLNWYNRSIQLKEK